MLAMLPEGWLAFVAPMYNASAVADIDRPQRRDVMATVFADKEGLISRISAAVSFLETVPTADTSKIVATGYCFGGSIVADLARANVSLAGVVSYHGGLSRILEREQQPTDFGDTRVLMLNGADDPLIPRGDVEEWIGIMQEGQADFEFTDFSDTLHSFTRPDAQGDRSRYDLYADQRSWLATHHFLNLVFGFSTPWSLPESPATLVKEDVSFMARSAQIRTRLPSIIVQSWVDVVYVCLCQDGDEELTGYIVYDSAKVKDKAPVVIVTQDWDGVNDFERMRADATASLDQGYLVFASSVYPVGSVYETIEQRIALIGGFFGDLDNIRSRMTAIVEYIKEHELADPTNIIATGYCFGGSSVLELARAGVEGVKGVVSFHGGLDSLANTNVTSDFGDTKVLILTGNDDDGISRSAVETAIATMKADNASYEVTSYGNTVHSFTEPTADSSNSRYSPYADQRSWESMVDFFESTFGLAESPLPSVGKVGGNGGRRRRTLRAAE